MSIIQDFKRHMEIDRHLCSIELMKAANPILTIEYRVSWWIFSLKICKAIEIENKSFNSEEINKMALLLMNNAA